MGNKIVVRGLPLFVLLATLSSCSSLATLPTTEHSPAVSVEDRGDWWVVSPVAPRTTGVVFYPGGLVKPEAYLHALSPIAEAGYPVVIAKMPFDLAFFDAEKGLRARTLFPGVQNWVIGGHSLGGVASAMAVDKHPGAFAGIVFWASYPAKDNDLSDQILPALSISASLDGLSTPAKMEAAKAFLPQGAEFLVIEGGNHAQFGNYGPQKGDGTATITSEDQQGQAQRAVLAFLAKL